ncbi:purine-cytosine permease FCY21 [Colletotrichum salicis]|uniref:Purine-cytosine permease FCY21 n=1 Tax=Colletotrichum salicis TaxID=1209931 RepID=A0A135RQG7_9PEZI|nr:purine-cytosine permease FCY21 [Colletotrichum salicis]
MTSIVSGQTLTAVSQGDLSLAVGITVSVVGALPISFVGYNVPLILLLILGAAAGAAVPGNDAWAEAYGLYSVGGIINAMNSPLGGFGKFVSVLLAFSVHGLTACTLYSLSISFQSLHPILSRLPRYLYSVVIVAIIVPISIVASSHFYNSLSNFLSVVGYWTASYSSIELTEHFCFRRSRYSAYDVSNWDNLKALPLGFAAVVSLCCSFGLTVPSMDTAWYTGPIALRTGDIGIELGIAVSSLMYIVLRSIEA